MSMIEHFNQQFAIPVLREKRAEHLEGLSLAVADGGLRIIEITLMSDEAYTVIRKLSSRSDLIVGAGTVTNIEEAKKAIDAGAKFLVSPGLPENAVEYSLRSGVPFYPGVLTPTEIIRARDLGCELLKIFPASSVGGPNYLKALQGPFPELKWMATGGVSVDNMQSYFQVGATCVGIGNQLTPTELVNAKDWKRLSEIARTYTELVKDARKV